MLTEEIQEWIQELVNTMKDQNIKPPYLLCSKEPIDISTFPEIENNVNSDSVPFDTIYIGEKRLHKKLIKGFTLKHKL